MTNTIETEIIFSSGKTKVRTFCKKARSFSYASCKHRSLSCYSNDMVLSVVIRMYILNWRRLWVLGSFFFFFNPDGWITSVDISVFHDIANKYSSFGWVMLEFVRLDFSADLIGTPSFIQKLTWYCLFFLPVLEKL